ncbi:PAS domain-containing hybrid sensor histidine kinase/response regulator, partial [Cryobacterium sp. TMT2-10]|uniref:hybrid sensor histidine kinase/response regulator n=1 Tax=Cryobacterium sp. TMT2-10 TaxID=1259244 RepID=UPI00141BC764
YELTYVRKDGSRFPAIVSVTALRDARETIIGYLLIGTDNTAGKLAEEELLKAGALQEANIQLEHASRMKSEFLATMSHELRTPLNAIIGFSEALKDGLIGDVSDTQAEYIGDIFTSGQHLLSLINDILDLSKVEAGMMALELEPVDVKSLLLGSLSIVREKAAAQRIQLEIDSPAGLGAPRLDLRKTKQIVYNLLANAVKFSAPGGRVVVRARHVSRGTVGTLPGAWPVHAFPLADNGHDEFLEISVEDSGIGISERDMARLFRAFSQIDSGLARKFEGTGLGLAMVKQLAELHGGTVAVASAEGEGARFAAWLPLAGQDQPVVAGPRPAEAPAVRPEASAGSDARIALVVADDDQSADLVRLLLEAEDFTVVIAADFEAALELAMKHALSLIILEVQLPGGDGWDFLVRIRGISTLATVPVVVVAGLDDNIMALARGASAVLQRPVSRAGLRASLTRLGLHSVPECNHAVLIVDDDPQAIEGPPCP